MERRVGKISYPGSRCLIWSFSSESFLVIWTLSMMTLPGTGGGWSVGDEQRVLVTRSPYIEPPHQQNLTIPIGQTAFLRCPVKHLGDKTVSWMRRRDLHILTSGNHIFTSDSRVSLLREKGSWTLRLESVERKDDSPYECQINTEPKMRLAIFLTVVGSQNDEWVPPLGAQVDYRLRPRSGTDARILGPSTVGLRMGSVLELTCLVSHGDPPPSNIHWFHGESPLPAPRSGGGGIEIQTSRGGPFTIISKLKISRIQLEDAGKYSCGDGIGSIASVFLQPLLLQGPDALSDFGDAAGESSTGRLGDVSNSDGATIQIPWSSRTTTPLLLVTTFLRFSSAYI